MWERCASGSDLPRVKQPGEEEGVRAGGQRREALPDGLEDGPGEVARVEAGQGDQEEVERVAHLAGAKDEAEGKKMSRFAILFCFLCIRSYVQMGHVMWLRAHSTKAMHGVLSYLCHDPRYIYCSSGIYCCAKGERGGGGKNRAREMKTHSPFDGWGGP